MASVSFAIPATEITGITSLNAKLISYLKLVSLTMFNHDIMYTVVVNIGEYLEDSTSAPSRFPHTAYSTSY